MLFYSDWERAAFFNASLLRAQGNLSGYHIGRQRTDGIHTNQKIHQEPL